MPESNIYQQRPTLKWNAFMCIESSVNILFLIYSKHCTEHLMNFWYFLVTLCSVNIAVFTTFGVFCKLTYYVCRDANHNRFSMFLWKIMKYIYIYTNWKQEYIFVKTGIYFCENSKIKFFLCISSSKLLKIVTSYET